MFYSKSTGGFYSEEIHGALLLDGGTNPDCKIPTDAVSVSDAQYAMLMDAQATGKQIAPDANGAPVASTPVPTAAQIAAAAQAAQDKADALAAKQDAVITQLMNATPQQIRTRLNTAIDSTSNATVVSSLRDELAKIEMVLGVLARKL